MEAKTTTDDARRPGHDDRSREGLTEARTEHCADGDAALEIMLALADADAGWGDYGSAVRVLDLVRRTVGDLPLEYELKRLRWTWLRDLRG
jgi:hypothetical protein